MKTKKSALNCANMVEKHTTCHPTVAIMAWLPHITEFIIEVRRPDTHEVTRRLFSRKATLEFIKETNP